MKDKNNIKFLKGLQDDLSEIRNDLSLIENKITDFYAPLPKPKKGYVSFRTSRGFVSFKLRRASGKKLKL
jgi:hypothetical protein